MRFNRTAKQKLWLNAHRRSSGEPFLLVQDCKDGYRTIWRDTTTEKKMYQTKTYLERVWGWKPIPTPL